MTNISSDPTIHYTDPKQLRKIRKLPAGPPYTVHSYGLGANPVDPLHAGARTVRLHNVEVMR